MGGELAGRLRALRAISARANLPQLAAKSGEVLRREGPVGFVRKVSAVTSGGDLLNHPDVYGAVGRPSYLSFPGSLLLVGNRDLVQCFHYRVEQKWEAARHLGLPFLFADSRDLASMLARIQVAGVLVLYRVAWSGDIARVVAEARRLSVPVVFETDDIVHRRDLAASNPNLATLPPRLRRSVVEGSDRFMRTLKECDHVVGSTQELADELANHVPGRSFVVNNAIDAFMDDVANSVDDERREGRLLPANRGCVTITYGSGSLAHDRDFAVVAPALRQLMRERQNVRLRLVGTVKPPDALASVSERVELLPSMSYGGYLRETARADICIAPLERVAFNRYKSQVKYLEAGLLGRALVASSTVYDNYLVDGSTGLIADSSSEWFEALRALVDDPNERDRVGRAARDHVRRWSLSRVAQSEYLPLATDWPGA